MSEDSLSKQEIKKVYPHEIKTRIVGKVSKQVIKDVVNCVKDVFELTDYNGPPPEMISISEGSVVLSSGDEVEACYGYDDPQIPGRIYVSSEKSKGSFGSSDIPIGVAAGAFAAHEAMEHVNHMRGKTLLSSHKKLTAEEHHTDTEDEANQIARKVVEARFGWTVYFGDELDKK